jgi:predicted ArsR family transcriptional regulator
VEQVRELLPAAPRNLSDDRFSATVAEIVSAFGDPTRRSIYLFTRESNGVTASEVAARFRLHPNVARHHLDKLAAGGYLDVFVDRKITSGAGRPSKKYRGSKNQSSVEATSHADDLLSFLLTGALERLSEEEIECMANEVGEKYGRMLASEMKPVDSQLSLHQAMRAIADALTAHGFAARSEPSPLSRDTVVAECCPFGSVATSHPVLCAVDRGIVRGMLTTLYGGPVPIKMSSRARGDKSCAVSV